MRESFFGLTSVMMTHIINCKWTMALDVCNRIQMMLKRQETESYKENKDEARNETKA